VVGAAAPGAVDIDTLPPEPAGVDGPGSRPEHGDAGGHNHKDGADADVVPFRRKLRQQEKGLANCRQYGGNGSPEARKQEEARGHGKKVLRQKEGFGGTEEAGDAEIEQGDCQAKAKQEESRARPVVRKR
jgi:hypothetical protein